MTSPFHQLHHISLVVRDIEKTVAWYESMGVGPWKEFPAGAFVGLPLLEVPNPEAFALMKYRYCDLDNVQLQLCEPPADLDSPQRRFLDEHGEGVYILSFEHPWEAAAAAGEELGLEVLQRGRRANGTGFIYFDTLDDAGAVLMARQSVPTDS